MKLKAKFTLIVCSLVITILVLTAFFSFSHYKKSIKETIVQQQFRMVSILADEIDSKLLTAQQHLIAVAKTAPPDIMQHPEKAQAFLDNKPGTHVMFDNHLFLFTPSGKIFVESPYAPGRRGLDLSFREYIINTLKTKNPYVSDPYVSSQPHKHPVIMLTVPLFDRKGKITGILTGSIDLMRDNFLGRISTVKIGKTGYFYLTATDRTLIMHPDKKRILTKQAPGLNRLYDKAIEGFEGTDDTITSYGTKMVSSFKRMKAKNWILGANYPSLEAYRPIRQAKQYFLMATITGIIAVFFIISFIIKYLIKPLELFTRHVEDLPQKTGDDRFLNIKTKDEIGTLSLAFNKMVTEIDKRSALERSEELYRTVIEFSTDFVFWTAPDNRIIYVSENCEKFCGYTEEEFYAAPGLLETMIHPDDRTIWAEHTHDIDNKGICEQLELRMVTKSGQVRWIAHNCMPVYDKKGNYRGRRASHQDITQRKELEDEKAKLQSEAVRAAHLASIGELAAGVAHEINNPITGIISCAEMFLDKYADGSKEKEIANRIIKEGVRVADIVKSLLSFARQGGEDKRPVRIEYILSEALALTSAMLKRDCVEIKLSSMPELRPVIANFQQIQQVFLNVINNSRYALNQKYGGKSGDKQIRITLGTIIKNKMPYVRTIFLDNGTGISGDTIEKVADPFFSTKPAGVGTGLGLSISHGIISDHDGMMTIDSVEGDFARVIIDLPASGQNEEK